MFKEYSQYDATGLAALVKSKEVTAAELLNTAIARAEAINPHINAIVMPMYEQARNNCDKLRGPFAGVPFLLKDLLASYKGVATSNGSEACKPFIADYDSTLVARYQQAGLNIFGKTNTPELGLLGVTEPEAFGATRNPWNLSCTPGGSSGGSAAAVAAGIVPMASAGDGGGSIRIPCSYCDLFGLKPSRGCTPSGPDYGEIWDGAAVQHVVTRTVRDSAAMLDATAFEEPGSPYPYAKHDGEAFFSMLCSEHRKNLALHSRSPLLCQHL